MNKFNARGAVSHRNLSLALTLVIAVSFCIGCSEIKEIAVSPEYSSGNNSTELIPLAVGNFWVRIHRDYGQDALWRSVVDTSAIDSSAIINDEEWFLMTDGRDSTLVRNTSQGMEKLIPEISKSELMFKYPVEAGDQWQDVSGRRYYTLSTDVTIEVRAGVFNDCIHYRSVGGQYDPSYDYWIKPGVGHVKIIDFIGGQNVYELVEYDLK